MKKIITIVASLLCTLAHAHSYKASIENHSREPLLVYQTNALKGNLWCQGHIAKAHSPCTISPSSGLKLTFTRSPADIYKVPHISVLSFVISRIEQQGLAVFNAYNGNISSPNSGSGLWFKQPTLNHIVIPRQF